MGTRERWQQRRQCRLPYPTQAEAAAEDKAKEAGVARAASEEAEAEAEAARTARESKAQEGRGGQGIRI